MKRYGFTITLGVIGVALIAGGCSQMSQPVAMESPAPPPSSAFMKIRSAPDGLERVPGSYIVVLKESVADANGVVGELSHSHGVGTDNVYSHAIKGFSAHLNAEQIQRLAEDDRVEYIEPDMIVTTDAQTLPWGVNNVDADVSTTLAGNGTGSVTNVRVYVIDTGIQRNHPDLNVVSGIDFTRRKGGNGEDDNGHGTHVAGTIAAKDNGSYVVGVAPGAPLYAVKVLAANGTGSTSNIVAGIDYVTAQKQASPETPMVANMSLGGYVGTTAYGAMDNAVLRSINAGVFYSIAAGNSSADARLYSPAHVVEAVTVGAYGSNNAFATSYSNFGAIVDINGPGSSILSTYKGTTTATLTGTSMASPHVCGTAALYLSVNTAANPLAVRNALVASATNNAASRVTSAPAGTTNLAVYAGGY